MNLTQRPPRSLRILLGGYALLPRLLDKCRAEIAGTSGEYHYNCPLDQHFFKFTGVDQEALKAEVAKGLGDGELLEWITANAEHQRTPWEIRQWSDYQQNRTPDSDGETRGFFSEMLNSLSTSRDDVTTWATLLDLDDYVTFGGKA